MNTQLQTELQMARGNLYFYMNLTSVISRLEDSAAKFKAVSIDTNSFVSITATKTLHD